MQIQHISFSSFLDSIPQFWEATGSLHQWAIPKDSLSFYHNHDVSIPQEDDPTLQVASITSGPTDAIADPSGSSMLLADMQERYSFPYHSPELAASAEVFNRCIRRQNVHVYGIWQDFLKPGHYGVSLPQGTLEDLFSFCPHCWMSYLDPSKFCHRSREFYTPFVV